MYTQCEHCKAIFRVNMREITVAKGKLRCGECDGVFNATDTLSTTLPLSFNELAEQDIIEEIQPANIEEDTLGSHAGERVLQSAPIEISVETSTPKEAEIQPKTKIEPVPELKPKEKSGLKWLLVVALLLLTALAGQVLYNNKHYFTGTPLHEPDKIQMLNHNIFAHPNESGALLISALIENSANHAQPYPALELRLEDSQSKLVAFRRFMPKEYLLNYSKDDLIPPNTPISLKLKIKDPGDNATRFQFKFL